MEIHLRPAGREDGHGENLERIFALDRACFRPGIAWSRAELRGLLLHPRTISLIAEQEGALAGFAIAEVEGQAGHIATIDVDPGLRRQGVGRILMEAIAEQCRKVGAARLRLEVAVDNHVAIAFYRMLGFVETGCIPGFYLGSLDALTMEKELAD